MKPAINRATPDPLYAAVSLKAARAGHHLRLTSHGNQLGTLGIYNSRGHAIHTAPVHDGDVQAATRALAKSVGATV